MSNYREFSTIPDHTAPVRENGKVLNRDAPVPLWSGKFDVPPINARVRVNSNGFGDATVAGYFTEDNWLGLLIDLDVQPEWHRKQQGPDSRIHVFGAEISLLPA